MKIVINRNALVKANLLTANTWKCPRCGERTSDNWCDGCEIHFTWNDPTVYNGPWTCDYCETINESSWSHCIVCDHHKPLKAFWA